MNELKSNLILNKGNLEDLILDIQAICKVDDLLMETHNSYYGDRGDKLGLAVMDKYSISQKELQANFIFYRSYEVRQ